MRQKRRILHKERRALISNENITRQFQAAIEGLTYRNCADRFNRSEIAKREGLTVSKDTVCRLANGDFQVVNKRIKALCQFFGIDVYEGHGKERNSFGNEDGCTAGIDVELTRVSVLAKSNPVLEQKLTKLIRGITEIVSSQGV